MIKVKLFLILKREKPFKSIFNLVEGDLDHFLKRKGFIIMSYEVRED